MATVDAGRLDAGALVRHARLQSGLTQHALAERAGVTRQTVAVVETGRRRPSLPTLTCLLAAAGLQMRVELEPLDDDVRRAIEERRALAEPAADVVGAWGGFATFSEVDRVAYRVEGLAAAALLGAPVGAPTIHLALADTDATYEWLTERSFRHLLTVRVDGRWGPLEFPLGNSWGGDVLDDAAVQRVRGRLADECPDGRFRLESGLEEVSVRLAPADEVARRVLVATAEGQIAVQPLDEIEVGDPEVARVLRVLRSVDNTRDRATSG
jgi:transcriptional regulator with XRE-family HTH domain